MANKIPKGALRFVSAGQSACAFVDDEGKEKIQMTVYSGGVIEGHWWWDNLIMDLEGVKFSQKVFPILENHNTDRKIGFHRKPIVTTDGGIQIDPEKSGFVDTNFSQEFRKLSKEGFPYQASLYGKPLKIQRFGEDEEVTVNGHKVKGPGTVWREWEFKESSVCVFGWDSKTKASAFSKEETEEVDFFEDTPPESKNKMNIENMEGGESIMDLKELQEKHPDLFAQVVEQGKKEGEEAAKAKFEADRQGFQSQIDATNKKMTEAFDRTAKLEKELALSREETMKTRADNLFALLFSESSIDPRLEDKVRNQVNHNKYVKDEKLDEEAFTAAVKEEIKDWESRLSVSGVAGYSTNGEDVEDAEDKKFTEQNKNLAADLLARAGFKKDK